MSTGTITLKVLKPNNTEFNVDLTVESGQRQIFLFNQIKDVLEQSNIEFNDSNPVVNNISFSGTFTTDTIDYGGLTIQPKDISTVYPYGIGNTYTSLRQNLKNILNLNITANSVKIIGVSTKICALRKYTGNIVVDGKGSETAKIFSSLPIEEAQGDLIISNITSLGMCDGINDSNWPDQAFNWLDIRNVDTSKCTEILLLNHWKKACTVVVGNFSNEKVTNIGLTGHLSPGKGRVLVHTQLIPPKLKNCTFVDGVAQDVYSNSVDWVNKINFEKILVPEAAYEAYINDTFVEGGTVGTTGWSRYRNRIQTYKEGEYEPRSDKKWLCNKPVWE